MKTVFLVLSLICLGLSILFWMVGYVSAIVNLWDTKYFFAVYLLTGGLFCGVGTFLVGRIKK